jgi:hypothetical protein
MMVFRNRKAAFLWGFMAAFMALLAAMSYVLLRDGPPPGYSLEFLTTVMGIFWIGGLGGCCFAASHPCVTVTVQPHSSVLITHSYPFRREQQDVPTDQVVSAGVVESPDDEGNPYFFARAKLIGGLSVDLFESHDRHRCESECARFNQAVFGISESGVSNQR